MPEDAPPFEITFDPVTETLRLTLRGFWSLATLASFTAKMVTVVGGIRRRHPSFAVLSDSRAFAVQSTLVGAGFTALMSKASRTHKGATAIVVSSMTNKLQAERVLASPRLRVFLNHDEATAWLAQQGE